MHPNSVNLYNLIKEQMEHEIDCFQNYISPVGISCKQFERKIRAIHKARKEVDDEE
jgi:hypothetical protein